MPHPWTASDQADEQRRAWFNQPDALATCAVHYANAGIAVFPCVPREKRPLTPAGFHDATTNPARVALWWDRWPQANIAAPTGHLFDVIDIDGTPGVHAIAGSKQDPDYITGIRAQALAVASTPRPGGLHYYVKPGRHNHASRLLPGVDTRGAGGYVLLPPSILDDYGDDPWGQGRRYTWLTPLAGLT